MAGSIRAFVVSDHGLVREGIRALLHGNGSGEIEVVGDGGGRLETLIQIGKKRPHVVIADVLLGKMSGLDFLRQVKKCSPTSRLLVLSPVGSQYFVRHALKAGASGYVLMNASPEELIEAIRNVYAGQVFLCEELAKKTELDCLCDTDRGVSLTPKEIDILRLMAQGRRNAEIAQMLCISLKTLEWHRANISRKLGLTTRVELVRYAVDNGLAL